MVIELHAEEEPIVMGMMVDAECAVAALKVPVVLELHAEEELVVVEPMVDAERVVAARNLLVVLELHAEVEECQEHDWG